MKTHKASLLVWIVIAIVLGIAGGQVLPCPVMRLFSTFNSLFSSFLGFLIPILIFSLVAPAIADIGKGAGKLLGITLLISYVNTVFAGFMSYFTGISLFPNMLAGQAIGEEIAKGNDLAPYFSIAIPPIMDVMTALVLAFTIGLCMACLNAQTLKHVCNDLRNVILHVVSHLIIPLLPFYIFGIFLNMSHSGYVGKVMLVFVKIIGIIFILHILLLLLEYCVAGLFVRRNPFKLIGRMMPAYFTALGTQSSAATIPVTLRCTLNNKVNKNIADFVIPLCATIHLSGSELKIVATALAILIMQGTPFDFAIMLEFILMLAITCVAAPGVPGGCIMAALGPLQSILGFGELECGLMIAIYVAIDCFGTACNVTGDGAIAIVLDKYFGNGRGENKSIDAVTAAMPKKN